MPNNIEKTSDSMQNAALTLIKKESTLTLSTTGNDGPWSAPVYYVFIEGIFYFFSSPNSRHILQALKTGRVAASLFHQSDVWQSIRGIQMTGTVKQVRSIRTSVKAISKYLKHFPFTREFFPDNAEPDLDAFSRHFKARLYAFLASEVFYTDNRFGFGTRRRVNAKLQTQDHL